METVKPNQFFRCRAALLAGACLIAPVHAGESRGGGSAGSESARRAAATMEARELLLKGDESYTQHRYADAVDAYAGARGMIPDAPASQELREAATQRLAQASVERARELSRLGDVPGAKAVMDRVLAEDVAPRDPGALAFRAQLDDPIRTNPALTAAHARDVDQVRRQLYTAEGNFDLGKYDEADESYKRVLRIDPTNTAARRGMERVAKAKSGYYQSANDHARAEILAQVDKQWELVVPPNLAIPEAGDYGLQSAADFVPVREKLDRIMISQIALDQATLSEALDFLRLRVGESAPDANINFAVNLSSADPEEAARISSQKFDLRLVNVPLSSALKYLTDITRTSYTTDNFSVIVRPLGSTSGELITETYRVTPDFIGSISNGSGEKEPADPFGAATTSGAVLATRMGAQEALVSQGVSFPEGASASYMPSTNLLRVVNTRTNQDYIARIVENLANTEPLSVVIRVTMIKVQQTQLEELGFDWMLNQYGFGGPAWVPGQARLNLSGGTTGNGDLIDDIAKPPGVFNSNPITAGNRSGDGAFSGNGIDDLLTDDSRGRQQSNRAPGVLGLRGSMNGATLQALMRGLDQKKGIDMMAQPATVTRSGQVSKIAMTREFIYPIEFEPPQLPNTTNNNAFGGGGGGTTPVTPTTPTAFETRDDVGITLEVLPLVGPDKKFVNITLTPKITNFDGFVNYGSPINTTTTTLLGATATVAITQNTILQPVFSVQSVTTNVDVADGGTVYVGGLLQDAKELVEDKTPILGSIPLIGRLFQTRANKNTSTAVLFLVNVELLDPTGQRLRER